MKITRWAICNKDNPEEFVNYRSTGNAQFDKFDYAFLYMDKGQAEYYCPNSCTVKKVTITIED